MSRPSRTTLAITGGALALSIALATFVTGCGSSPPAPTTGSSGSTGETGSTGATGSGAGESEPATACTASEDCALVQACCGCTAGGRQIAIRADAVAAYEAARPERCADQMCAQVMSQDPSCTAEAICGSDGQCEVAPHLQHE